MPETINDISDSLLFSYVIASADMRYIEVGEREIYLRTDPQLGLVVRGEMSGFGSSNYANLSRILLEFALTCEGCDDQQEAGESAVLFGVRLGRILVDKLCQDPSGLNKTDNLSYAFECVVNSLGTPSHKNYSATQLRFTFDEGPLNKAAQVTGIKRGVSTAHRSFVALCKTMLRILAPDWILREPSQQDSEVPIREVVLAHSIS